MTGRCLYCADSAALFGHKRFVEMSNRFRILLLLSGLFVIELSMQVWRIPLMNYVKPAIWLLSNFAFCALALWWMARPHGSTEEAEESADRHAFWTRRVLPAIVFSGCAVLAGVALSRVFKEIPVDPYWSDIIPSIQLYVTRLLGGEAVYVPMEFPGWTVLPTYFPMMWLPYIPAEVFGFDYRWVAFGLFAAAVAAWVWKTARSGGGWPALAMLSGVPFLVVWLMATGVRGQVFGMAVELMPVALYLFLALALMQNRAWVWAAAITACLLSRYAFTFWLPVFFLVALLEEGWWKSVRTGLFVAGGVLLLYVLPFLSKDWTILQNGLDYYHTTAVGQWHPQSFQSPGEKPFHLKQGFSFALLFYDLAEGEVEDRLALNQKVHLLVCSVAALLLFAGYFRWRKRLDWRIYLLIGLKFYLSVFYGFFHVPFSYLYWLPLFLALPIFALILVPRMPDRCITGESKAKSNFVSE